MRNLQSEIPDELYQKFVIKVAEQEGEYRGNKDKAVREALRSYIKGEEKDPSYGKLEFVVKKFNEVFRQMDPSQIAEVKEKLSAKEEERMNEAIEEVV